MVAGQLNKLYLYNENISAYSFVERLCDEYAELILK
nr:MAG TPA: hypothetical protein [Caudoviricetes sp.]